MKGDLTCVGGRIMRHDPQNDDPDLETDIGECPDCSGQGCGEWNGDYPEPVAKLGRSPVWLRNPDLVYDKERRTIIDSRDTDQSRTGMFVLHNCSRCNDGNKQCVGGNPRQCEYPYARND